MKEKPKLFRYSFSMGGYIKGLRPIKLASHIWLLANAYAKPKVGSIFSVYCRLEKWETQMIHTCKGSPYNIMAYKYTRVHSKCVACRTDLSLASGLKRGNQDPAHTEQCWDSVIYPFTSMFSYWLPPYMYGYITCFL